MTAPAISPKLTRQEKARQMGRQGYTLSESVSTVGVFYVGKCGASEPYIVDVAGETCTCVDFCRHGNKCKHFFFVETCCRWWRKLEAMKAAKSRTRRRFSKAHLAAFRALSPSFAAPTSAETPSERYGSGDYKARITADFC